MSNEQVKGDHDSRRDFLKKSTVAVLGAAAVTGLASEASATSTGTCSSLPNPNPSATSYFVNDRESLQKYLLAIAGRTVNEAVAIGRQAGMSSQEASATVMDTASLAALLFTVDAQYW